MPDQDQSLIVTQIGVDDRRITRLLDELRAANVNGGVLFAGFRVGPANQTYSQPPSSSHRFHRAGQNVETDSLFDSMAFAEALPELAVSAGLTHAPTWRSVGAFVLDGEITQALVQGGAYDRFRGPLKAAKRIAEAFCDALFEDRYLDIEVFRSDEPWSPWFMSVAWDITWLIVDRKELRIWLLCVTDTD